MSERIVIDPITRIEGHLRVEAEIEGGTIKNAYSSGTMVRGIENIVKDRDPRDVWAFVGRVCGVCTSIHSLASVRAVENARGIVIPPNASMVRNIMQAVLYMHDHTVHFYQLHALDWVDVVSALKADPKAAAFSMGKEYRGVFHRHSRTTKEVRCQRAAWYIRQWVLGTSGL